MSSQPTKQSGFTLIEMASVMAISGLLAVVGLPMVNDYKAQSVAAGAQKMFAEALVQARTMAVSHGKTVKICGSRDGKTCSDNAWSEGWLVYHGDGQTASGETITDHQIIADYRFEDTVYALQVFDEQWQDVHEIRFDTQGFNLAQQRLAATVCVLGSKAEADAVLIERTGRVRVSSYSDDRRAPAAVVGSASSSTSSQCKQA